MAEISAFVHTGSPTPNKDHEIYRMKNFLEVRQLTYAVFRRQFNIERDGWQLKCIGAAVSPEAYYQQ